MIKLILIIEYNLEWHGSVKYLNVRLVTLGTRIKKNFSSKKMFLFLLFIYFLNVCNYLYFNHNFISTKPYKPQTVQKQTKNLKVITV